MRIVYVCGSLLEAEGELRPLPPLEGGGPRGNMYRTVEALGRVRPDWRVTFVSGASKELLLPLRTMLRHAPHWADYRWIEVPALYRRLGSWMFRELPPSQALFLLLGGAYSLHGWTFLRGVRKVCDEEAPDLVVLDSGEHFLRGMARFVPRQRLVCFCRGELGLSRKWLHLARAVFVATPEFGDWVRSANQAVREILVIPNSLDPAFLRMAANPRPTSRSAPVVLFVGRLVPEKGIESLIRAFALVHRQMNSAKLVIVGAEREPVGGARAKIGPFESEMRRLAQGLLPARSVEWRGWLGKGDLLRAYLEARVCVFPSTSVEAFGMVALEAMACGIPVVASSRPGFNHLIGDDRGFLVQKPEEPEELAQAILMVLRDPATAAERAARARKYALQFTPERSAMHLAQAVELVVCGSCSTVGGA